MKIHAVTLDVSPDDGQLAEWVALSKLVDRLHLRFPTKTVSEVYRIAAALLRRDAPAHKLIVHDHVDVALLLSLPAVQCGRRSPPIAAVRDKFPRLTIGASVHSVQGAIEAERAGANYILFGHVFPTASKDGQPAHGAARLREVVRAVDIPVIAIGGVTPDRLADIAATGARGAAVQGGIFRAHAPLAAAETYSAQAKRENYEEASPC